MTASRTSPKSTKGSEGNALTRSATVVTGSVKTAAPASSYLISPEYLENMPELYKDVLGAFPQADPVRAAGDALPYQSIYSVLEGKYSPREIKLACEQLAQGRAVEIRNTIFIHPTGLGEQLIAAVSGVQAGERTVPTFSPPPPV